ncbi:MAG: helix-turn-helix transcriptional regulator [Burkholderiaceae bacterium]|nr:helix-turn-helix transcriptional regulator [Burkholderiaceae bacterium]
MNLFSGASAQRIFTRVSHTVRTATVRDDLVGWVVSGRKRLATPSGETRFAPGQVFVIPRSTQWDMINEAAPGGHYEARLMSFAPQLVERFHERFGQFAGVPAVQSCASSAADEAFLATFGHATAALNEPVASQAVREHRALEVLLLLSERGLVFAPARELAWADRVHRLVGQRPHAGWTVDEVASAFHASASTLQRRLADEGTSVSRCVREVRLEAAMVLLQQGAGLQVSEIAARCGYDSHSRFSAAFRQRFGFAPSHLRP